jgi:hypothetical protein
MIAAHADGASSPDGGEARVAKSDQLTRTPGAGMAPGAGHQGPTL